VELEAKDVLLRQSTSSVGPKQDIKPQSENIHMYG
jgi:hypothetical protein